MRTESEMSLNYYRNTPDFKNESLHSVQRDLKIAEFADA